MNIYERTRSGKPVNPARALYDYWHTILAGHPRTKRDADGRLKGSMAWGVDYGCSIAFQHSHIKDAPVDTSDRPPIAYTGLTVTADGTFRLGGFWGWNQRDRIARNTFLRWGYVHSEYVWYVDTSDQPGTYSTYPVNLQDWENPVPYLGERVLTARNYTRPNPWLKLSWDGGQWAFEFAKQGEAPYGHQHPITKDEFDWYQRLRAKRYDRYEHAVERALARAAVGQPPVSNEEQQAKALAVIIASMNVSAPARTVPLRKTTEEVGLWEPSGCP